MLSSELTLSGNMIMIITSRTHLKAAALCLGLSLFSTLSIAQSRGDSDSRERRGPPPQALEACNSLAEGDACSFEGRRGQASGSCIVVPTEETALACKPSGKNRPKRQDDSQG